MQLLRLISTPGFGFCISYAHVMRWETCFTNAIIDRMTENSGVNIPFGLRKGHILTFHIDDLDFLEGKKDGKATTHVLSMIVFQKNTGVVEPLLLNVGQNRESLKPKQNNFNDLQYCRAPLKKGFKRTEGCESFNLKM